MTMVEDIVANSMRNYEEWKREQLRDQFAMAALTGFVTRQSASFADADTAARFAYAYADAMLAAREAK